MLWVAACGDAGSDVVSPPPVVNRPPAAVGNIPAQTVFAGETAAVDVSSYFSDPDGDALSYTAVSSNAGVAGVAVTGSSVTVTALAKGGATVTVEARDPQGLIAQQRFVATVPNRAPEAVGAIPAQTVTVGETAAVDMSSHFGDPDGDSLTYAAASSDTEVATVSVSGDSVAVTALAKGLTTITVTARDGEGLTAEQRFAVTVPNRAPETGDRIPDLTLFEGEKEPVDAAAHFRDPDGDSLSYTAASSNASVATVAVSGSAVVVSALANGMATVTVSATDPDGSSATSAFGVTVETPSSGSFQIELVFATSLTRSQEAVFRAAAERWMKILAPTELADRRADRILTCGDDPRFERYVETIDDLMIVVAVGEIDGPGRTLGVAGPCWVRTDPTAHYFLPLYGRMEFDEVDLERMERSGDLEDVILHEMGHVLGIGTIWEELELLRNPASETEAPDTHFTGRLAIAAFDEAGGTAYKGAKVPVENTGGAGTRNGHWRRDVFGMELMIGWADGTATASPVSAITVQSLADLGYAVDVTAADPYRLPTPDAARLIDDARRIPYGDDIWRGPIVVVDPDGRIVRVIPG